MTTHPQLTPTQQTILEVVTNSPAQFNRSELAKLLAGTRSKRLEQLSTHSNYRKLASQSRKSVTMDIDILLQQRVLERDGYGRITVG